MFDRLAPRRTTGNSNQRQAILRGVYHQNRDLHVDGGPGPQPRRRRSRGRLLLLGALAVMAIGGAHLFDASIQPGRTLLAAAPPPAPVTAEPTAPGLAPPATLAAAADAAEATTTLPPPASATAAEAIVPADLAPLVSDQHNLKSLFGLAVKTIVIDAGHGGHDPGALGKLGTQEKDITLDVARRLKDKLEAEGAYRILMVRDDDSFVALNQRAAYANDQNTDLFVSIHVNYLPSTSINAVETYYFGRHDDARTRKLAERENEGSEYSLSEFENVMRNMQDTIKLQESKALAHTIQASLLTSIRARKQRVLDNGVRTAPFVVLLGVKAPSVLVEIGSLSSPDAERSLGRDAYRDEIASYVAAGIARYLNRQTPEEQRIHEAKNRVPDRQ